MNYYIADTHFGHENIMRHCNRPFTSVDEQDEILIKNWNNTVGKNDTVYIIGDFCFKSGKGAKKSARKQISVERNPKLIPRKICLRTVVPFSHKRFPFQFTKK